MVMGLTISPNPPALSDVPAKLEKNSYITKNNVQRQAWDHLDRYRRKYGYTQPRTPLALLLESLGHMGRSI